MNSKDRPQSLEEKLVLLNSGAASIRSWAEAIRIKRRFAFISPESFPWYLRSAAKELVEIAETPVPNPDRGKHHPEARFLTIKEIRAREELLSS